MSRTCCSYAPPAASARWPSALPSAQGGVGPFQYFATQALTRAGVAGPAAAAYALALHLFLVAPVSLVGLVVLWRSTLPGARKHRITSEPTLPSTEGNPAS